MKIKLNIKIIIGINLIFNFISILADASDLKYFIKSVDKETAQPVTIQIEVVTADECKSLLEPIFFPEKKIQDAISALSDINREFSNWKNVNCIDDLLVLANNQSSYPNFDPVYSELEKKILDLTIEKYLTNSAQRISQLNSEISKLKEEQEITNNIEIRVPQLSKLLREKGDLAYIKWCTLTVTDSIICKELKDDPNKIAELNKKIEDVDVAYNAVNQKFSKLQALIENSWALVQLDNPILSEKFEKLRCFWAIQNKNKFKSKKNDSYKKCEAYKPSLEEASTVAEDIQKILDDIPLHDLIKTTKKKAEAEFDQKMKHLRAKLEDGAFRDKNNLKHLLNRLIGEQKRNNGRLTLNEFCLENEATQLRDKRYSELNLPTYVPHNLLEKTMRETGLSEIEIASIYAYTDDYYSTINRELWSGKTLSEKSSAYKETTNAALNRLPAYTKAVRRFSNLPQSALNQHQVGETVNYLAYTSTSKRQNWHWDGKHSFTIYGNKNGHDISSISAHPGEEEALFKEGTKFKVISRTQVSPEKIEFILVEINDDETKYDVPPPGRF